MKVKNFLIYLLFCILFSACGSLKKPGDPGGFDGSYLLSNNTEVIIFPIYESYEVEFQMFGDPILFYFDDKSENGDFIYISDDSNLKFIMKPGLEKGVFYEINEPPLEVTKE